MTEKRRMWCHFCAKDEDNVELLIAGPFANICNKCVAVAAQVVLVNQKESAK